MKVQTRNVYYFSGFDPRGPAFYSRLFRSELRKSGYAVGAHGYGYRNISDPLIRQVHSAMPGDTASSGTAPTPKPRLNLYLMKWDDIVRSYWLPSPLGLLFAGLQVYLKGLANISLRKVWLINHGTFWAGLFPLLSFALILLSLTLIFALTNVMFNALLPASIIAWHFASVFAASIAVTLAAHLLLDIADKAGVFWLVRIFRFNLLLATNKLPEIPQRQEAWAESILRRQTENPSDEIVLVGHSVGTIVMMEVVRILLNDPRWKAVTGARPIKVLTLGNCIPFVSLHAEADRFRATLRALSHCEAIEWWDITAKADPLCFYLSPPLGETREPQSSTSKPKLLPARFFRMYELQKWKRLRRNKLRLHFLYLATPEIDCDFNLYRLICSENSLETHLKSATHG